MTSPQSMLSKDWYTLNGDPIDDISVAIKAACQGDDKVVIIGTDSQQYKKLEFVTSVIVYTLHKGGRVFYTKTFRDYSTEGDGGLRRKLVDEAWLSIYAAWEIEPLLPSGVDLASIHVDVNPDKAEASSKYHDEICWLVKGQNFEVVSKPWSFASTHVSEHIVKHRPQGRTHAA